MPVLNNGTPDIHRHTRSTIRVFTISKGQKARRKYETKFAAVNNNYNANIKSDKVCLFVSIFKIYLKKMPSNRYAHYKGEFAC